MRKRERINILSNLDTSSRKKLRNNNKQDITGIRSTHKSIMDDRSYHQSLRAESITGNSNDKFNNLDETDDNNLLIDNLLSQLQTGSINNPNASVNQNSNNLLGIRGKTLSTTLLNIKESNYDSLNKLNLNSDSVESMCYWLEKNFSDSEIRDLLQIFKLTFNLEEHDWVEPELNDIPINMHASHEN